MTTSFLEVLDAWELLGERPPLDKLSMTDWTRIEEALVAVKTQPTLGSVHVGVGDALAIAEGHSPLSAIAAHALQYEAVWLPDPVFSFVSQDAQRAFKLLPEGNGTFFDPKPSVGLQWKSLWMEKPAERRALAVEKMPPILARVAQMRPLIETGALRFYRWEPMLLKNRQRLQEQVRALANDSDVAALTERYSQGEYSLGVRGGRIDITAGEQTGGTGHFPKKGERMFFANKSPMVLSALFNAAVSTALSASFAPQVSGDRVLYDRFVSGGYVDADQRQLVANLKLPRFAEAAVSELAAIRRDSETMAIFRDALRDAAGCTENTALISIEQRLRAAADRLNQDASLRKAVGGKVVEGAISTFVTALATLALTTNNSALIAGISGASAFLATLLPTVVGGSSGRKERRDRAELLIRVADKL